MNNTLNKRARAVLFDMLMRRSWRRIRDADILKFMGSALYHRPSGRPNSQCAKLINGSWYLLNAGAEYEAFPGGMRRIDENGTVACDFTNKTEVEDPINKETSDVLFFMLMNRVWEYTRSGFQYSFDDDKLMKYSIAKLANDPDKDYKGECCVRKIVSWCLTNTQPEPAIKLNEYGGIECRFGYE